MIYSWTMTDDWELDLINFLLQLVLTSVFWGVYALGRRFTGLYDYMIAASFVAIFLTIALYLDSLFEHHEDPGFVIFYQVGGYLTIFLLLLAPSIHFVLLYLVVFTIEMLFVVSRYYNFDAFMIGFGAQIAI